MPPEHAAHAAAVRRGVGVPIAMVTSRGSYHPEGLVQADAVDVVRLDASTNGGVSGLRRVLDELGGRPFSTHMFPHVHSRLLSGLGVEGVPIEWGIIGNGVDQASDTFSRPVLDGWMEPLPADRGFGMAIHRDWFHAQASDDPDELIGDL